MYVDVNRAARAIGDAGLRGTMRPGAEPRMIACVDTVHRRCARRMASSPDASLKMDDDDVELPRCSLTARALEIKRSLIGQ